MLSGLFWNTVSYYDYIIDWGTYDGFAIDLQTTVLEFMGTKRDVPLIPLLSKFLFFGFIR